MILSNFIDHTNLKPMASLSEIQKLCGEAKNYGFYAVCVNGCHVSLAAEELKNTKVKIAAVVGFPLGAMSTEAKIFEARECVKNGADEIDMVINIGWLKSNEDSKVRNEIKSIKRVIGDKILKVILENCYLTTSEKEKACTLAVEAGADFVKTSTGFGSGGATFEDVILMKKIVGDKLGVKASGGIKDKETALKYIDLGVSRIGTSSGIILLN
ncbi:deoxyribose-phosphate aldolase [Flagellimonas alvinocaridis]|uniref:Deoxyribose-phosphate aldolase n=1 Tax=Flagellimonas alvinocaridis TaxID=2530200 RepID=A0A4S8RW55_9FLAO|nr:deoxyribose-phosphate aldolase [Allomuricauda alvinocaridis]THV58224.1 deoxyribose-phosphate aldolase [Allomuricauda alvinocaridis]